MKKATAARLSFALSFDPTLAVKFNVAGIQEREQPLANTGSPMKGLKLNVFR